MENLPSRSVTQKDVKAMQASKYTDLSNTSDKNVSADDNVLSFKYQGDPDVLYTNESSEKIGLEKDYLSIRRGADNV